MLLSEAKLIDQSASQLPSDGGPSHVADAVSHLDGCNRQYNVGGDISPSLQSRHTRLLPDLTLTSDSVNKVPRQIAPVVVHLGHHTRWDVKINAKTLTAYSK